MPDTLQNQSNAVVANGTVADHLIEEGMSRMKIESNKEEEESGGGGERKGGQQYPDRPGEPDCLHYVRTGFCGYASNCRFNHPPLPLLTKQTAHNKNELPQREGQADCQYFLKTGDCKFGPSCKYHHPPDRRGAGQVLLNSLGLPVRQGEKACTYYVRNFKCKFGAACKFNHPEPATMDTVVHLSGTANLGATGGTIVPPALVPYVGAYPVWPQTRSSYIASSRVPGQHTYVPLTFPPLQGPAATQSWNGYMGNLSPFPMSNLIGQDDLLTMSVSHLPERPDQPECRHFMSTGDCKYGQNCRYHHPKDRMAKLTMSNLGPHGLPLRPGETVCDHFNTYGRCNYGVRCKFNHPLTGVFPFYYGLPSMPFMEQPYYPGSKNQAIPNKSETSQSKSLKITDWIQKPETVEDKNVGKTEVTTLEDSQGGVDNGVPASSELSQEQTV